MRHAWLALLLVFPVFAPAPLIAQISGRVLSNAQVPLPGVSIELWQNGHREASTTSRVDGRFEIAASAGVVGSSRQLRARRIGFRPVSVELHRDSSRVDIVMEPLPIELAAVTTEVRALPFATDPCSRNASPVASDIYARAASHYRDGTRWLDRVARYVHRTSVSDVANRESLTELTIRNGWTRNTGFYSGTRVKNITAVPRILTDSQLFALPFPVPEVKFGSKENPTAWNYPRFHEWAAPSFVSRAFVDLMPKSIVATSPTIVLAFCPRDRRAPFTSGEIELSPDSTIAVIRWRFKTSSSFAETGGVAYFDPPRAERAESHLLPRDATTWTQLPKSKLFEVTEYAFGPWQVAARGKSVGPLPSASR